MPPVKLSKVTFPPPSVVSPTAGGAPTPPAPPAAPPPPTPDPPIADPPVADPPGDTSTGTDPSGADTGLFGPPDVESAQQLELQLHAAVSRIAASGGDVPVFIPTELVDKVWKAVTTVPGLSIASVLTMALQQFLRTLPQSFEQQE